MSDEGALKPPSHLSKAAAVWWREIANEWKLDPHHLKVLTAAAEAYDRMVEARKLVKKHGILIPNRFGELKQNPACNVERDSRTAFLRAVRELDLDVTAGPSGPPRVSGRR